MRAILLALPMLTASFGAVAEEGSKPPEGEAPGPVRTAEYLLVDHLSAALYEGEPMTACLRVENTTSGEESVVVKAVAYGPDEAVVKEDQRKVTVPAGGQAACRFDLDLRGVRAVRFSAIAGSGELPGPAVRILRDDDPWPGTSAVDGRLTDDGSGQVLLPVVTRKERKEDRSFSSLSWLVPTSDGKTPEPAGVFLYLPGEWLGDGNAAWTRELIPGKLQEGTKWRGLGPYPLQGVAPILMAVGDCLRSLPKPAPGCVLMILPAEDLDVAVDPRLYRTAIEILVSRLEAAGVRAVVFESPVRYGVPEARHRMLAKAVQEALEGRRGRALDSEPLLDEVLWRLDPGTPGAYGAIPNSAGRKKIRQVLDDLIR